MSDLRKVILMFAVSASAFAQCGVERRPVKTLADKEAVQIHLAPKAATVTELRALKPPAKVTDTLPRQESEKQVYEVSALLVGYKLETDSDYHVVIAEPGNPRLTMIVEIPSPRCGPGNYSETFTAARVFVDGLGGKATPKFRTLPTPIPVKVKGMAFFDKLHGQTGVAPNGVELHPVIDISFGKVLDTAVGPNTSDALTNSRFVPDLLPHDYLSVCVRIPGGFFCTQPVMGFQSK